MKRNNQIFTITGICLSLAVLTAGCGGGGNRGASGASNLSGVATNGQGLGSGRVVIAWPARNTASSSTRSIGKPHVLLSLSGTLAPKKISTGASRSRLIPQATGSITVEFFQTDPRSAPGTVAKHYYWIQRPTSAATSTITIGPLEARTYFVRLTAYATSTVASAEGEGNAPVPADQVPLASTVSTMSIVKDRADSHLDATLASTVAKIQFSLTEDGTGTVPSGALVPNKKYRLAAKALDSQDREVVTMGENFAWSGFGTDAVPESTTGSSIVVRFSSNANVTFTVRDIESGKDFSNTINTSTATFGNPGSVLGVAGEATGENNTLLVDLFPTFDNVSDVLASVDGIGPQGDFYAGFYTSDISGLSPVSGVTFDGITGPGFLTNISNVGGYVNLTSDGNDLIATSVDGLATQTVVYTAPGTIAGFKGIDGNEYVVGYQDGDKLSIVHLPKFQLPTSGSGFTPTKLTITPIGTDALLYAIDKFGDIYVQTTNNGRKEVRRYDDKGRLSIGFGPIDVSVRGFSVTPNGRIRRGDDIYTEDGLVRLGSIPGPDPSQLFLDTSLVGTSTAGSGLAVYYSYYRTAFTSDEVGTTPFFASSVYFTGDEIEP